jgi:hypothetical protein
MDTTVNKKCKPQKGESPVPVKGVKFNNQTINLVVLILSVTAAYFMTIQSIKIDLAAKAEDAVVETLDKKLVGFEVILKEGVVSKREFFDFTKDMEVRLDRIERHLITKTGDTSGNK